MFSVSPGRRRAFTLLELVTVIIVIAILVVLIIPVVGQVQRRLAKTRCMAAMRGLHVGVGAYVQDRHNWPQIPITYGADQKVMATAWIEALKPYGINAENWICPTIQKNLGGPDFHKENNVRVDYIPFPYGRNPQDPFRYATQPWFIENADVHGNGNLMIFPDGHVEELVDFLMRNKKH